MSKFLSGTLVGIAIVIFIPPIAVAIGTYSIISHRRREHINHSETPIAGFLWVCRGAAWTGIGICAFVLMLAGFLFYPRGVISAIAVGIVIWLLFPSRETAIEMNQ